MDAHQLSRNRASPQHVSDSLKLLSLSPATQTPLPPSPVLTNGQGSRNAPSDVQKAPPLPLRRSSSTVSFGHGSTSPALSKRASVSSLRNGDAIGTPQRHLSRRTSSTLPSSPGFATMPKFSSELSQEAKPSLTASAVAAHYFEQELALHETADAPDTVVVLHDSCYGHRYSRPKTSKAALSTIVERPERIQASVVGLSAAYVRLGGRHAGGRAPPHPKREPDARIPFKILKTRRAVDLGSPIVTNVHGTKWMEELKGMCASAGKKLATTGKELSRSEEAVRTAGQPKKAKLHEGDLYLCPESLDAFQGALGGVCDGVDAVFEGSKSGKGPTRAFVCIRPPGHHCSSEYPSGFCWLNNVHVGIEYAAQTFGLTHAAIIDFDLHHGDGSQSITWDHNAKVARLHKNAASSKKTSIGYFSIHDINSYPCEEGEVEKVQNASLCIENAHGQSIWNVHLQPWKTDADFWNLYETRYVVLIHKARDFLRAHSQRLSCQQNQPAPKAAIFISAGFDASEWESQGMQRHKVNVPTDFYARITQDIVRLAQEEGTSVEGRVISVLEGGYSDRALISGVLSHISGLGEERTAAPEDMQEAHGLGLEMVKRIYNSDPFDGRVDATPSGTHRYESYWWSPSELEAIESLAYPAPSVGPQKKPRNVSQSTFYSPTQSSAAKAVDPFKMHRTGTANPSRPSSPPPPDVDWATAAHALSKLLIPSDRQISSFTGTELSEPRGKKERASNIVPIVQADSGKMQLRRKAKVPDYAEPATDDDAIILKDVTKANRRKTIADVSLLSDATSSRMNGGDKVMVKPRRRLSVASSSTSVSSDRKRPSIPIPTAARVASTAGASKVVTNGSDAKTSVARRAPANSKQTTERRRVENKQPTANQVTSSHANEQGVSAQNVQRNGTKASPSTENVGDEMDNLTSAIGKITIKVPAGRKYEELEKRVAEETKRRGEGQADSSRRPRTTTGKAVSVAKKALATNNKTSGIPQNKPLGNASAPDTKKDSQTGSDRQLQDVLSAQIPLPGTEAVKAEPKDNAEGEVHPTSASDIEPTYPVISLASNSEDATKVTDTAAEAQFIAYEPNTNGVVDTNGFQGQAVEGQPSLRWLPPNSDLAGAPSSPANRKGKGSLPVFTSHGHIPFAVKSDNVGDTHDETIWEVPNTPTKDAM